MPRGDQSYLAEFLKISRSYKLRLDVEEVFPVIPPLEVVNFSSIINHKGKVVLNR